MKPAIESATPDNEIVSSRIIEQPIEKVFEAWSNPEHLKNWWGPAGFTNTFHEFDLRPGGKWIFTMHGPEKGHYENSVEFVRVEPPTLITWRRHSQPFFDMEIHLEIISPTQTQVIFRMIFPSARDCEKVKNFIPDKNEENFDRLEEELKRTMDH